MAPQATGDNQNEATGYIVSVVTTTATPAPMTTTVHAITILPTPTAFSEQAISTSASLQSSAPSHHPPHRASVQAIVFGTAGAIALVIAFLVLIGGFIFCCRKRRKRVRQQEGSQVQMAMKTAAAPAPDIRRPSPATVQVPSPSFATSSSTLITPAPRMPEPVILPNNGSYFTGIDTSDQMSIIEPPSIRHSDNIYPSGEEEPPPPYRPRSVPSISRESSLRVADGMRSHCGPRNSVIRSPFDDPVEEDADIEGNPFTDPSHREHDRMSVVSDLSYQQEPTSTHSTI
jgi:hypothetical protein